MGTVKRFWVIKLVEKDGGTAYVYATRDGFFFVPKYSTKNRARRKNKWAFSKINAGKYVIKHSRLDRIKKFEWEINERNRTPHAKMMRKRMDEVAAAAAAYLEGRTRRGFSRRKKKRHEEHDE